MVEVCVSGIISGLEKNTMLDNKTKDIIRADYKAFLESKNLKGRSGQQQMIADFANVMSRDNDGERFYVAEAGTGTGKTLSYLASVIPVAMAAEKKVVISTATVALQDQVIEKDIPALLEVSSTKFKAALVKGRGRYVCLTLLEEFAQGGQQDLLGSSLNMDDIDNPLFPTLYEKLRNGSWQGDRDTLEEEIDFKDWNKIRNDKHSCIGAACPDYEQCPYYSDRRYAATADVLVANHDIVLADISAGGGIILPEPEECIYVFDEGHHLPIKALGYFETAASSQSVRYHADIVNTLSGSMVTKNPKHEVVHDALAASINHLKVLFVEIENVLAGYLDQAKAENEVKKLYRFPGGVIGQTEKALITEALTHANSICDTVNSLSETMKECAKGENSAFDPLFAHANLAPLGRESDFFDGIVKACAGFLREEDNVPNARWIVFTSKDSGIGTDVCFSSSPITAGGILRGYLWNKCYGAAMVSATLMAGGNFGRFQSQAGLPDSTLYRVVGSPFDYPNVSQMHIPRMGFEPNKVEQHSEFVADYILEHTQSLGTLVLFSSRKQLDFVHRAIEVACDCQILAQGSLSKSEIIDRHKIAIDKGEKSIIFGLDTFAEGLDLPGNYCSHVIIAKLPFSVPDQPVDAALSEYLESQGKNPFMEISVPDAIIKLKQAVGRLIRTESDTGIVAILDERLRTKRYGKLIMNSLPPMRLL